MSERQACKIASIPIGVQRYKKRRKRSPEPVVVVIVESGKLPLSI